MLASEMIQPMMSSVGPIRRAVRGQVILTATWHSVFRTQYAILLLTNFHSYIPTLYSCNAELTIGQTLFEVGKGPKSNFYLKWF